MSKSQISGLWRRLTKKLIDIMRFTHVDFNFDVKYEGSGGSRFSQRRGG